MTGRLLRVLWALPATMLGLPLLALALAGGRVQLVEGVVEAHGPGIRWLFARVIPVRGTAAMTIGHIVIGRDARCLDATRLHERAHVRQYERWGAFFIPAYFLASAWAMAAGGHYYHDNAFERAAVREERIFRVQSSKCHVQSGTLNSHRLPATVFTAAQTGSPPDAPDARDRFDLSHPPQTPDPPHPAR